MDKNQAQLMAAYYWAVVESAMRFRAEVEEWWFEVMWDGGRDE